MGMKINVPLLYQQDPNQQNVLTGFLGFNTHVVPVCSFSIQSLSDSYGSIVWVYFESVGGIGLFVD